MRGLFSGHHPPFGLELGVPCAGIPKIVQNSLQSQDGVSVSQMTSLVRAITPSMLSFRLFGAFHGKATFLICLFTCTLVLQIEIVQELAL